MLSSRQSNISFVPIEIRRAASGESVRLRAAGRRRGNEAMSKCGVRSCSPTSCGRGALPADEAGADVDRW